MKNIKEPLYIQIYSQLKKETLDGVLKEYQVLAGSRSLAKTLNVSRNTVDNAYSQLLAEGYIKSKKGTTSLLVSKRSEQ
jgi:GntR family transcriptional regulator/MocR family aminotransferase